MKWWGSNGLQNFGQLWDNSSVQACVCVGKLLRHELMNYQFLWRLNLNFTNPIHIVFKYLYLLCHEIVWLFFCNNFLLQNVWEMCFYIKYENNSIKTSLSFLFVLVALSVSFFTVVVYVVSHHNSGRNRIWPYMILLPQMTIISAQGTFHSPE